MPRPNVVILCGGLGTRLRPVISDRPKVLAQIGDQTFLDILITSLRKQGFKKIILCVGYLKDQIKDHFKHDHSITFSDEEELLGTGGALKNARSFIISNSLMVLNGDSLCKVDYQDFYDFHMRKRAIMSMVLVKTKTSQDFGSVVVDKSKRIIGFKEKGDGGEGLVNAGIYLMQKHIFSLMPDMRTFSLEYDLFTKLVENKRCYGYITDSELIDIGTPKRLKHYENIYRQCQY